MGTWVKDLNLGPVLALEINQIGIILIYYGIATSNILYHLKKNKKWPCHTFHKKKKPKTTKVIINKLSFYLHNFNFKDSPNNNSSYQNLAFHAYKYKQDL